MSILEKVSEWVNTQSEKQENRSSLWSWLPGLIIVAVATLGLSVAYFQQWRQGRELAKLKHERDVRLKMKKDLETMQIVTKSRVRAVSLQKEVVAAMAEVAELDAIIDGLEKNGIKKKQVIKNFTSWRDVDRHLNGNDS